MPEPAPFTSTSIGLSPDDVDANIATANYQRQIVEKLRTIEDLLRPSNYQASGWNNLTAATWVQVIASTDRVSHWVVLTVRGDTSSVTFSIGTGGSGSETAVCAVGVHDSSVDDPLVFSFPLEIDEGQRITLRPSAGANWAAFITLIGR